MSSDQVKYRTQTDMTGIWATKEEMDIKNASAAAEGDMLFQELIMGELSPEDFCEKMATRDAWAKDSLWIPEKFAE